MSTHVFWRNVVAVLTGTVAAQSIPLLASLLIARLFAPADFGLFATWLAVVLVAAVAVTGRFEISLAQEVGRSGVTLNVVSPGATNTELRQEREAQIRAAVGEEKYQRRVQSVLRAYPTGRIGEPHDVASAIAFLASDQASWITGQVLSVNGGYAMP